MFNAIGAHVYAGGFTCGVRGHFNVLAHLEHSGYGAEVVNLNYPDLPIHDGGPASWPKEWPKGAARVRFMYANPPCAIWSGASHGRAGRWQDDPRLDMHKDIFHYAMEVVQPDVLVIESVPPSFVRGREYIDWLIEKAGDHGYSTTIAMHDAQMLGVPQKRSRIFYTFHKVEFEWTHPPFGAPMTVRQALKGIRPSKKIGYDTTMPDKYAFWAAKAGPGEGLAKIFDRENPNPPRGDRGQIIGRPSFLDHRSPWDAPAGVVIGGKPIHPTENRFMAQEEVAAICGFPKDFKWPKGSFNDISGYMSRGVMPPVGAWIAENVNRALERNRRLNHHTANVLDVRKAPGAYYELQPVTHYDVHTADSHGPIVHSNALKELAVRAVDEAVGRTQEPVYVALHTPAVHTDPVPPPQQGTVVVDWSPRICGATSWCGHLRGADAGIELMSFSKSGRPLAQWESAFPWTARKIADAAAILNDYDRVILGDIACFAPDVAKDENDLPYYEAVMAKVTNKWTGIFHGGTYPTKHDATIDKVLSSPGFCGTLLTPRIGQAQERLAKWPTLRFEHHPYLPYDPAHAPARRGKRGRVHSAMMTARLNSNKGQNAGLILTDHLIGDLECWGYNPFGLPSIAWGLWELAQGLGYGVVAPPILRADKADLKHPNAPKFYTGKFEVEAPNSHRRFRYHDGYVKLDEVDWSPWVHLSLGSTDFAGILEYTIIDAVHAGAVVVVPECWPTEGVYKTVQTYPFEGSTAGWDAKNNRLRETRSFDRAAVAKVVNGLLKMSDKKLSEIADAQYAEFSELHKPQRTLDAIDRALSGQTKESKTVARKSADPTPPVQGVVFATGIGHPVRAVNPNTSILAMSPEPGEKSGAFIRRLLTQGVDGETILTRVHACFPGSKASKSDINWNKQKLKQEGIAIPATNTGYKMPVTAPAQQAPSAPVAQPKYAAPGFSTAAPAAPAKAAAKASRKGATTDTPPWEEGSDEVKATIEGLITIISMFAPNAEALPAVQKARSVLNGLA